MIDRHYFHRKNLTWEAGFPIHRTDRHDAFLGIPVTVYAVKDPRDPDGRPLAEFEFERHARAWAQAQQERRAA